MKPFLQDGVHMGTQWFPWLEQKKDAMVLPHIYSPDDRQRL